jgi:hypothetical protein
MIDGDPLESHDLRLRPAVQPGTTLADHQGVAPTGAGPLDRIRRRSEVTWARLILVERLTATSHQPADPSALLAHVVEPLAL